MTKVLLLIASLLFTSMCVELSQNEIDNVEQLLAELKGSTQSELVSLEEDYQNSHADKLLIIDSLKQTVANQAGECNARDQDYMDRQTDIRNTQDNISLLKYRIDANDYRITNLRQNRCDQNLIYVLGLANQKITLRLVIFLRNALQAANDSEFSLIQKQQMGNYVVQFLSIYKHAKKAELLQLTKEINETFNLKVDVENGEIPQDFVVLSQQSTVTISGTKQELIDILNSIEEDLRKSLSNSQDQEVRVGIQLAEFFALLETENITLGSILVDEQRSLISLRNQLATAGNTAANCKSRLQQLQKAVVITQQDIDSQTELYTSQHTRLESEIGLFDDVYRIYSTQVATSDDQFKAKVQTYVSSQSFINKNNQGIQGYVAQAVREQIARQIA